MKGESKVKDKLGVREGSRMGKGKVAGEEEGKKGERGDQR